VALFREELQQLFRFFGDVFVGYLVEQVGDAFLGCPL
jgi:hypothetical protein